ncbi:MAG: Uncharacterised protein [SAR116 cluster bacterium MED-G04]|jgi:hypothetical protein|nr:MAG: Uncharacterised protein [SAR116 cluster bacterium MED-G04]
MSSDRDLNKGVKFSVTGLSGSLGRIGSGY